MMSECRLNLFIVMGASFINLQGKVAMWCIYVLMATSQLDIATGVSSTEVKDRHMCQVLPPSYSSGS